MRSSTYLQLHSKFEASLRSTDTQEQNTTNHELSRVCCYMPLILASSTREDPEFRASLGCVKLSDKNVPEPSVVRFICESGSSSLQKMGTQVSHRSALLSLYSAGD